MKKAIAWLVLAIAMLPVFSACAEKSDFVGTWVAVRHGKDDYYSVEVYTILENSTCYHIYDTFTGTEPGYGIQNAGQWIYLGDGAMRMYIGTAKKDFFIDSEGRLGLRYNDGTYMPYQKIPDKNEQQSGVYVPAGAWKVGQDIPAGSYSITRDTNKKSQTLYVYTAAGSLQLNTILNAEVPTIGRVDLEDGSIVNVGGGVYFNDPIVLGFGQ